MKPKNPNAVALGSLGRKAMTKAQAEASRRNAIRAREVKAAKRKEV